MSADTYLPLEVDQDMRTAIGGAFESRNFVTVGYLGDDVLEEALLVKRVFDGVEGVSAGVSGRGAWCGGARERR
jgi:hypothetical protein